MVCLPLHRSGLWKPDQLETMPDISINMSNLKLSCILIIYDIDYISNFDLISVADKECTEALHTFVLFNVILT
jgi:hypothetical protein